mgnify:CR=1 FL=1
MTDTQCGWGDSATNPEPVHPVQTKKPQQGKAADKIASALAESKRVLKRSGTRGTERTCMIGHVHVVPRLSSVTTHLQPSLYSSSEGGGGRPPAGDGAAISGVHRHVGLLQERPGGIGAATCDIEIFPVFSHFSKKLDLLTLGFVTDIQFVDTWANFYSHTPYIPIVLDNGATCHRATRFSGLYVTLPPTRDFLGT